MAGPADSVIREPLVRGSHFPEGEPALDLTIVSTMYNEEDGAGEFMERLGEACRGLDCTYEIVVVDDGSKDETLTILKNALPATPHLRVVELGYNVGQVHAIGAGFSVARGKWVLQLDGDLQHDPADIPRLLAKRDQGYDLVLTYRTVRSAGPLRRVISKVINPLYRLVVGVGIRDFGSAFRLIEASAIDTMRDVHGQVHANFVRHYRAARKIGYVPIRQGRRHGKSKYTLAGIVSINLDIISTSGRLIHLLFGISVLGAAAGFLLYLLKIIGFSENVLAMSAPVSIFLSSVMLGLLTIVWHELVRTQLLARGLPPFRIRAIWRSADADAAEPVASPNLGADS